MNIILICQLPAINVYASACVLVDVVVGALLLPIVLNFSLPLFLSHFLFDVVI